MLTQESLREFVEYRPGKPVLSVYLNVDPADGAADTYKLKLRQLVKPFERQAPADAQAMERFIEHEYDWAGRGLALYSCAADGYFRAMPLSLPVRSRARLLDQPYVKPLADLFENYAHYGIALVDRQSARLFHFHLGTLEELEGTHGAAVRHMKHGGGSQAAGRRGGRSDPTPDSEEIAERNLKVAADTAARRFHDLRVRRLMVGGTEENVSLFLSLLPKAWRSLVVGTFPIEMTAGTVEVLEKAIGVAEAREHAQAEKLVNAIITNAAKGREGVVRLDDVLEAVHAGKVQILAVSEGFQAPGYRCQGCGYLTAQSLETCPFCGHTFSEIEDAVEMAVRRVIADGGEIQIIHDNPSLEKAGRIGALLRY